MPSTIYGIYRWFKTPKKLTRNSPTLLYAALQKGFFYDKRVGGLEGQIVSVIENENEFHTNFNDLETTVKGSKEYQELFDLAYPNSKISQFEIRMPLLLILEH